MNRSPRQRTGRARSLVLAALLPLLALAQSSCAALLALLNGSFQQPELTVKSVDITGISLQGISANFVFDAKNPNTFALDLGRFDYQLTVDGHALAQGQAPQGFNLPPQGTGLLTLPVQVRFVDFAESIEALFQKQSVPYTIHVGMGFNSPVGIIDVPVDHAGSFPVPRLPDIKLSGASIGDLGFSGETLHVKLGLANSNAFELPLGALNYHVLVEGSDLAGGSVPAPTLPAGGSQGIDIPVHIDFLSAGSAVVSAIQSGRVRLGVKGGLDLGAVGKAIPFSQETTISLSR